MSQRKKKTEWKKIPTVSGSTNLPSSQIVDDGGKSKNEISELPEMKLNLLPKMQILGGKVNGLITFQVSQTAIKPVSIELEEIFKAKSKRSKPSQEEALSTTGREDYISPSNMQEFGISFVQADRQKSLRHLPSEKFPQTSRLIATILSEYHSKVTTLAGESATDSDGTPRYPNERMNVIIRHYGVGSQIPYHVDRVNLFAEQVWSCVITCEDPTAGLHYQVDGKDVPLDEQPGLVAIQTGDARFRYAHGVPPLKRGQRISVTWRWFTKEAFEKLEKPIQKIEEEKKENDVRSKNQEKQNVPQVTEKVTATAATTTTTVIEPKEKSKRTIRSGKSNNSRSRVQGSWAS